MFYILLVMGLELFHSDNCLELSIPVLCNHNYGMQNGVYAHAMLRVYTPSMLRAGWRTTESPHRLFFAVADLECGVLRYSRIRFFSVLLEALGNGSTDIRLPALRMQNRR